MTAASDPPPADPPPAVPLPAVLLIGAGRMGGALFAGWCARGLPPSILVDPEAAAGVARQQDLVVARLDQLPRDFAPGAVILAVKPQMADAVLPALAAALSAGPLVLSIMAGRRLGPLRAALGASWSVVRAMPNTPAAIGQGITVAVAGPNVTPSQRRLCDALLAAVGDVAWVDDEPLIDAVTAISGSGPAYVFLLAELLEQAAIEEGLPPDLARRLARRTVSGSGALLAHSQDDAATLRRAVTSPGGTTERALAVLMAETAWPATLRDAVRAAARRSREL